MHYNQTSPIPEEAPVMRTTFPLRFSQKMVEKIDCKNLKKIKGGKKKQRPKKVKKGAVRLRKSFINSIFDQNTIHINGIRTLLDHLLLRYI